MYFYYQVTFTGYIRCFCATTSHDLLTLTFYLLTLRVFCVQCFSCPTHIPIFIILRLSVTQLWITEFDHISVNSHCHCACAVSRDLSSGAKMVHISEIPVPNLPIHFVTFRALRRRLSHVIGENSVYPIVKATKFTAHAQYHVTCAQRVPQNHTWQFFDPELSIYYTTFMGLKRRLRVVLY